MIITLIGCRFATNLISTSTPSSTRWVIDDCSSETDPWDIRWLSLDSSTQIQKINEILGTSGLEGEGETIFLNSQRYGVNPAFAMAMFRKESSFAARQTRAFRNRNPGNIIATGNCRGLPAGSTCSGYYGEIATDGRFGIYPTFSAGIEAYYKLLNSEYKPGSKRNCMDISCIIMSYCPPGECDVNVYEIQVTQWMQEYQCRLSSGLAETNLNSQYPQHTPTFTMIPSTPTTSLARAQIGIQVPLYLTYDPAKWDAKKINWSGGSFEILINKKYGCIIHDNEPRGTPENWKKSVFNKQVGNLTYEINSWTNTLDGITYLIIYHYPPGNYDNFRRIELVNSKWGEQTSPVIEDISLCVNEAEEVLRLSENEIINSQN